MSRLQASFRDLGRRGEKALIAYLTAGDPGPRGSLLLCRAALRHADILEVGIPFSDPIADGPVIQAATQRALDAGATPDMALGLIGALRRESPKPIVVLTYMNILHHLGLDAFAHDLARAGGDGAIVADLPVEEAAPVRRALARRGLDLILLAAPTSPPERLARIARETSGFLYLVSLLGVTGARRELSGHLRPLFPRVRRAARGRVPIAVGFGISTPRHVREVCRLGADGAIVGSAIVRRVGENRARPARAAREIERLLQEMKRATR